MIIQNPPMFYKLTSLTRSTRDAFQQNTMSQTTNPTRRVRDNPFEKVDVRMEISLLSDEIEKLRLEYEQFFTGLIPRAPEKLQTDVRRKIRKLIKTPLKNLELTYRIKTLEGRFNTLNTYWTRVQKQREEGTYVKDLFKANLRDRISLEDEKAKTREGEAQAQMKSLFNSYKNALEKETKKTQNLDFARFQKALTQQAKELKEKNGGKKVAFKVVIKEGKVKVEVRSKE